MTATAQICSDSAAIFPKRVARTSGHYEYKSWAKDAKGERVARKYLGKEARFNADLVANSYRNGNGLDVVFGIVFDLDAHRAKECWKDAEGKLDWDLIFPALQKEIPEVAKLICYAVRSTGGKGLGLVMAITQLPIQESTIPNQQSALKLQGRLLSLFDRMGLGADFGARGVCRDLPNFNHPDKQVYRNTKPLRELENSNRPVVGDLHRLLNTRDRLARSRERIYNDVRVEKGLSKLVLWLLGAVNFDRTSTFEGQVTQTRYKQIPFLSGWNLESSLKELCVLTGLSDSFLRAFLKEPPRWLKTTFGDDKCWTLALPLSKDIPWLLERSKYLMEKTKELQGKVSFDPKELCMPQWVQDGDRNSWLVRLALIYKWAGYSMDSTLAKIKLRLTSIPGFKSSRNCRQITSIVRSLYRRNPENLGMLDWKGLPDWIRDDKIFCSILNRTNTRRGKTPGDRFEVQGVMVGSTGFSSPVSPVPFHASIDLKAQTEVPNDGLSKPIAAPPRPVVTLLVVRRKQRIGIFKNNKLLMCLTKKHYKASSLLNYLKDLNPKLSEIEVRFVSPRKTKQELYFAEIDNAEMVHSAKSICGRKATRYESMDLWREKKGIEPEVQETIVTLASLEFESPF